MAWKDEHNGDPDICKQRFSSDGAALGNNLINCKLEMILKKQKK